MRRARRRCAGDDTQTEGDERRAGSRKIGSAAGFYDDWQAGRRIANSLRVLALEAQTLARACGKSHVHNLEPEDLVALTVEAAAMARVPLAGTDWIPGRYSA